MEYTLSLIRNSRAFFLNTISNYSIEKLNQVPTGYSNSIIWNVAHVVATFDNLVYKLSMRPSQMNAEFIERYQKGTSHQQHTTVEEIAALKSLLTFQLDQFEIDYQSGMFTEFKEYKTSFGNTLNSVQESLSFDLIHEGIHIGYVLAMKKLLN
jgi:hypothetical protein